MAGALYLSIPVAPTKRDLLGVIDEALRLPAPDASAWDTISSWFGAPKAGVTERLKGAIADLKAAKAELGAATDEPAGGALTERVRRACIIVEQELYGAEYVSSKNLENRAELLDTVTNPEAYVDAGRNLAVGGLDPAGLRTDDSPGLWKKWFPNGVLPDFDKLGSTVKTVAIIVGIIVGLLIVAAIVIKVRQ